MFKSTYAKLAVVLLLMSVWFCEFSIQPARADRPAYIGADGSVEPSTIIRLVPSEMRVPVGATFTVNVTVTNVTGMYTWQIDLFFDPTVLNCTNAWYAENHVFAGKEIVTVDPVINKMEGSLLYGCTLLGNEETFSGNGTLCQIQFIAVSPGRTALNFSGPVDTFLLDSNINDMPYAKVDGSVVVGSESYCDLNNDGKIDIADISEAARAFGSYPGHPRWNPTDDINTDGRVNIIDLFLIAKSFT